MSKYFSKGRMAVVEGRLQIREWTDKEGNKRRAAEVIANEEYTVPNLFRVGGYLVFFGGKARWLDEQTPPSVAGFVVSARTIESPGQRYR